MVLNEAIKHYMTNLDQQGLLRKRRLQDTNRIAFDSNDYLSLAQDKTVAGFYQTGYTKYPVGSTGSMLLNGYHANHKATEEAFANWLGVDECLLFPTGYAANLALCALLGQLKAHCLIDKAVHASIYDGLRLAEVSFVRYQHNNLIDLQKKLAVATEASALVTEGIFSMSGQIAPLSAIVTLCQPQKRVCLVDEAHSLGVLGNEGKGAVDAEGLNQETVPLRMVAFGKAFASQGALIAGQSSWIQALLQVSRSLIYSTAMSPALSYGLVKTLDVVAGAEDRRAKLKQLVSHFKTLSLSSPFNWAPSHSPIQQLRLGCPHLAQRFALELDQAGFSCSAIRRPTVSSKESGLRIIINAQHEPEQINQLFMALNTIYDRTPH